MPERISDCLTALNFKAIQRHTSSFTTNREMISRSQLRLYRVCSINYTTIQPCPFLKPTLDYVCHEFNKMGGTSCPPLESVRGFSVLWGGRLSYIQGAPEVVDMQSGYKPPCQRITSPSSSLHSLLSPELL